MDCAKNRKRIERVVRRGMVAYFLQSRAGKRSVAHIDNCGCTDCSRARTLLFGPTEVPPLKLFFGDLAVA